jgi:hypothetical protein
MTLRCPFCGATLATGRRWECSEGESGGAIMQQEYECAGCCAAFTYEVVAKVFDLRESWRLAAAPLAVKVTQRSHPTFPAYMCARCASGALVPAVPVGPCPFGPQPFPSSDTKRSREVSYLCDACAAQYQRHEHGSLDALVVSCWYWLVDGSAGSGSSQGDMSPCPTCCDRGLTPLCEKGSQHHQNSTSSSSSSSGSAMAPLIHSCIAGISMMVLQ